MKLTRQTVFLFLYALLLYLLFTGAVPLLDPDEPVYGETAKEMIAAGDWLSPRIYGDFWYDKPPLFYWMEAVSFSFFGVSTFTARLPSALAGAGTVVYLYRAACHVLPERTAFWGAFIFASSLEVAVIARSAVTDMALTAALTVAMMSFLQKRYVTAYIACGIALLAKGPIGFGFPALIVALWLIFQKRFTWKPIMALRWYWGIPLACAVGLPWYLYMTAHHGAAFIDTFLGYHNLTRFAEPEHTGQDHWYLYLIVLAAGCFPWSGAAFGAVSRFRAWRKDPVLLYFMVWAVFIFLFFSISSTQLFSYIMPLFPPLSLLSAVYLEEQRDAPRKLFLALHGLFLVITAAALSLAPLTPMGGDAVKYGIAAVLLAAGAAAGAAFARQRLRLFYGLQGLSTLFLVVSVWTLFAAPVRESFTSLDISEKLIATERESIPVYVDPFYRPAAAFYHDFYGEKLPVKDKTDPVIPMPSYVLVQKKVYEDWTPACRASFTMVWETKTALLLRSR